MAARCMCRPDLAALPMYQYHTIAPAEPRPSDHLPAHWPQAAVCSTEQTKNQTLKPYDQRRISANHHLTLSCFPASSLEDDSAFTQNPAQFYPQETVISQMSLSLGLD